MNDKVDNTAELRRLGELCVLMEGLFHVLATRDDINALRLTQRYRDEFNAIYTKAFATETPAETPTVSQCCAVPEAPESLEHTDDNASDELVESTAEPEVCEDMQPEADAQSQPEAADTDQVESCPQPVVNEEPRTAAATGELRVDEMLSRREARELRNAFTLNDKFRFRRELFDNDNDRFREALRMIEAMSDYDEALTYMRDDLGWDMDADAAQDFAVIVANHFAVI